MSKSILVIDTPENCASCLMGNINLYDMSKGGLYCQLNKKENISWGNVKGRKPDWCPLRDLPTKKPKVKYHGNGCFGINEAMKNSFNMGFNSCVEEILKGANGNE